MAESGTGSMKLLLVIVFMLSLTACASVQKLQRDNVKAGEKIGVYAMRVKSDIAYVELGMVAPKATVKNAQGIRKTFNSIAGEILVLRAFMNAFPPRIQATVVPVLKNQMAWSDDNARLNPDIIATGKKLGLDYFVLLSVGQHLKTTGYRFQEQWRPELHVTVNMVRIRDGKTVMSNKVRVEGMPFDKYMDDMSSGKGLDKVFANLSRNVVIGLMPAVGPVIREIPPEERLAHQRLQSYGRIRTLAHKNNCVISGDLWMEKTTENIVYHVPCRDITLTYACESEKENSRCWLQ